MNRQLPTRLALLILLFLLAWAREAPATTPPLTLNECIITALENSSSRKRAENTLQLQGADVLRSYGNFLPSVTASAGYVPYAIDRDYTLVSGNTTKITSEAAEAGLRTSLNIFNGFRDYASLQSALKNELAAGNSLERALETIVFDVTQAWYQLQLDRELLGIAIEDLRSSEDQLTLTRRQFEIGIKAITELYQQEAETANLKLAVIKAEAKVERSRLELLRRLQIAPDSPIVFAKTESIPDLPEKKLTDADSLASIALQRRIDLKALDLETAAKEWGITTARSSMYPTLDVTFDIGSSGFRYLKDGTYLPPLDEQLGNTLSWSVGLNLNWKLFDRFSTSYTIQSAKSSQINSRLDYEDLKRDIGINLRQALSDYVSAFAEINAANKVLLSAEAAYKSVSRKYELGATGFVDLSTARSTLFGARSSLTQARFNLALQKTILDYVTGTIPLPQQF